ncbi:hypothetical protein SAMN05444401_1649 [Clostridium amylolyticum]|uniref:YCII-related domain-containing protein n=1 Tax=Clostridium amylolyticum TaxID=1121298 RepID=A0A1M6EPF2_9CLOT|nr:hypothetical protein [Clostridium amylolyticum]SHI87385.1 hypothetical protein SAMN05444401_1649 [Clostridium amylolyticum]
MKKSGGIFVKINYKIDTNSDARAKDRKVNDIKNSIYNKYLACAGTLNKNGGTIIFQAKDLTEAEEIISSNPFINNKFYSYEILSKNSIALTSI